MALPGTARPAPPGTRPLGPLDPRQPLEVSVLVRPRTPLVELDERLARGEPPLSREAFAATYGADPGALAAVERFAGQHHLRVVGSDSARRMVVLRGTAADLNAAFGVDLQRFAAPDGSTFHAHAGPVHVPPELGLLVETVLGLDSRPAASRR